MGVLGWRIYRADGFAGAVPRFSRFLDYCELQPHDAEICSALCQGKIERFTRHRTGRLAGRPAQVGQSGGLAGKGSIRDGTIEPGYVRQSRAFINSCAAVLVLRGKRRRPRAEVQRFERCAILKTLTGINRIPKTGHYVFLSPCSPQLAHPHRPSAPTRRKWTGFPCTNGSTPMR